jgi:hypothetical protein
MKTLIPRMVVAAVACALMLWVAALSPFTSAQDEEPPPNQIPPCPKADCKASRGGMDCSADPGNCTPTQPCVFCYCRLNTQSQWRCVFP